MSFLSTSDDGRYVFITNADVLTRITVDSGESDRLCVPDTPAVKLKDSVTDNTEQDRPVVQCTGRILGVCVSPTGRMVAALTDGKMACAWLCESAEAVSSWQLVRKGSCLIFTNDESALLIADKSGDVYRCRLDRCEPPQLILGHLSMVLDLCMLPGGDRLVTCDRDEKVRVSCYPNTWSVDRYCLGHREFVASMCLLSAARLATAGGDGSVCLWDPTTGRRLCSVPVDSTDTTSSQTTRQAPVVKLLCLRSPDGDVLVALKHRCRMLSVYTVSLDALVPCDPVDTGAPVLTGSVTRDRLLVLRADSADPLLLYRLQATSCASPELLQLPESPLTQAASRLAPFTHDSLEVDVLYKQSYDNVSQYLEKKEERLKNEGNLEVLAAKRLRSS